MAQIWVTYAELADLLACGTEGARDRALSLGYDRRRCHDGLTRVKLPEQLADAYMLNFALAKQAEPSPAATLRNRLSDAFERAQVDAARTVVAEADAGSQSRAA